MNLLTDTLIDVLIDPGHGGIQLGATHTIKNWWGPDVIIAEKDINLKQAFMLAQECHDLGIRPMLTRYTDTYLSLSDRCEMEHRLRPDCTACVHINNFENPQAHGTEIWTSPGDTPADPLATSVIEFISSVYPSLTLRTDKRDGDPDKENPFAILTETKGPAFLFEPGFLSNPQDRKLLLNDIWLRGMTRAMALGIKKWAKNR